jgi:hypothetical protein
MATLARPKATATPAANVCCIPINADVAFVNTRTPVRNRVFHPLLYFFAATHLAFTRYSKTAKI